MDARTLEATRYWTLAQPIVSAYVTSVVRDFRDRDDVLQEVAVAVMQSFEQYDPSRSFVGWALGIARNQVGTYLRQRRRNRLFFDDDTVRNLALAFEQVSPERMQQLENLQSCISELGGRARKLCSLRYQNDLKPAAIATLLDMTSNAVAKALQRIREQLQACVERKTSAEEGAR
jgi:RNA polymerase sigma-70 factor (ECF subfamily)